MPTQCGTSKAGNPYKVKQVIINIGNDAQYPQGLVCKVLNEECIKTLERMGEGAALESVDVDFYVNEYNGKYYQENRLWRVWEINQYEQQRNAEASAPAPTQATAETGELPF